MARRQVVDVELDSDRDLTRISCRRVLIEQTEGGGYRVRSKLQLYRCEVSGFVERVIRRRMPDMVAYGGNASRPTGYFWDRIAWWERKK